MIWLIALILALSGQPLAAVIVCIVAAVLEV